MLKKISFIAILMMVIASSFAQESMNKKGIPLHPKKGDWGVGFDVVPILKYAGNLFHGTDNNQELGIMPFTVTARYCIAPDKALRMYFSNTITSTKYDTLVSKIGSTNQNEQVVDESTITTTITKLGFGVQQWRGNGRFRGLYGIQGGILIGTDNTKYSYGNPLSSENTNERVTRVKQGTQFGFGVRAFLGVEYFIAPRISVSAEYGYEPYISNTGANEVTTAKWDGAASLTEINTTQGKITRFGTVTDSNNGSISLLFYF